MWVSVPSAVTPHPHPHHPRPPFWTDSELYATQQPFPPTLDSCPLCALFSVRHSLLHIPPLSRPNPASPPTNRQTYRQNDKPPATSWSWRTSSPAGLPGAGGAHESFLRTLTQALPQPHPGQSTNRLSDQPTTDQPTLTNRPQDFLELEAAHESFLRTLTQQSFLTLKTMVGSLSTIFATAQVCCSFLSSYCIRHYLPSKSDRVRLG